MGGLLSADPVSAVEARKLLWRLLALSLALRVAIAFALPLGVDENYATAVAREFSWSFFDHPPLSFWAPVLAAKLTGIEAAPIYRLFFLIAGTVTTWALFRIGEVLQSPRAGLWGAVLFSVSPFFLLAGGVFVIPDGMLSAFTALCVLALVKIADKGAGSVRDWAIVGVWLALALASKYQAGLIPIATLAFALVHPMGRRWLVQPGPWVASAIGLLGLAPVLLWNMGHDWASFAFHEGRTGDGLRLGNFALMAVGQAIYLLPPVFVLAVIGLWRGLRAGATPGMMLTALIALGPIVMFNMIYLMSARSYPHWTMPGWIFALPLAGVWIAQKGEVIARQARIWTGAVAAPIWVLLVALIVHMNTGILTRAFYDEPPAWDRTDDAFRWSDLRPALEARGVLDGVEVLASVHWMEAGAMSTALGGDYPVRLMAGLQHHFQFMSGAHKGGKAILLVPDLLPRQEARAADALAQARAVDPEAQELAPVILQRGTQDYVAVTVISLTLPQE